MTNFFDRRREQQAREISQRGFTIENVLPEHVGDMVKPGYSYTIGLSGRDIPELIILGLDPAVAYSVLYDMASRMLQELAEGAAAAVPVEVDMYDVFRGTRAILIPAPESKASELALGSANYAEVNAHKLSYLQLVWPDSAGRFPWEAGTLAGFPAEQPILRLPDVGN